MLVIEGSHRAPQMDQKAVVLRNIIEKNVHVVHICACIIYDVVLLAWNFGPPEYSAPTNLYFKFCYHLNY